VTERRSWRRLHRAWLALWDVDRTELPAGDDESRDDRLEEPWLARWEHVPKRTAGRGFAMEDYQEARRRAEEVARQTLGEELWTRVVQVGHVDVPSRRFPGITYRLRVGKRIEVCSATGARHPWPYRFLCINPTYPLPEVEFFAHLYLYVRDNEDEVIRVAAPQPWDQPLGRTF